MVLVTVDDCGGVAGILVIVLVMVIVVVVVIQLLVYAMEWSGKDEVEMMAYFSVGQSPLTIRCPDMPCPPHVMRH